MKITCIQPNFCKNLLNSGFWMNNVDMASFAM
jgi:hypothetical protein